MSDFKPISAREWAQTEFWPRKPRCVGFEGECDGDLPGEEHIPTCPMFGKQPVTIYEFAEAYHAAMTWKASQP